MKMCVGLVEIGPLGHPRASKGIKMAPRGGKRYPAAKEPVAPDNKIKEVCNGRPCSGWSGHLGRT